ncbi:MAG: pyridoxal-5-phosphate-dependent protein subunit beta, partial [Frankiales bacterium]|nr:pyridoxal-5-phosphate-dependent protein subunit beta [Frankiales bacterium]
MTERRQPWVDAAKGVLILLVVLWHVVRKHYVLLPWVPGPVAHGWSTASFLLQPVRVPLFFVVSGYLASRAVRRSWPDLLRGRVLRDYWTYVVWLLLGSAFFLVGPPLTTHTAHSVPELLVAAVAGNANTWYLYALAAYVVVARLSLRLPVWLPLTLALLLAGAADLAVMPHTGNVEPLLRNLLPFLVAALRPDLVTALVARADPGRARAAAAVYLPVVAVAVAAGVSRR